MNRRNVLLMVSIFTFIILIGGVSYSFFLYNRNIGDVSLTTGEISITLSGVNGNQSFANVIPTSDLTGKSISNYFDFTVNATVDTERIYYEVYLLPTSGNTLDTSFLKTYLTDQLDNEINTVTLYDDLNNSETLNGKVIYKGIIETNNGTTRNETKDFRLRLWLDEDYSELAAKTFNFDIYLYAKNVDDNFRISSLKSIIASKLSESYIESYDDIIDDNPTFTTQDQVSTNTTKQTVYFFTGEDAAANANVLFAGYCWQIVRTTDNGGIRMIYNGVAVNNKCETTRTPTKGVKAVEGGVTQNMTGASLYGRSYDYNLDTGNFTIENSTGLPSAWTENDNNSNGTPDYQELIGTYTCLSNSNTCTTLYYVGTIRDLNSNEAHVAKYTTGTVSHYSELGDSHYNVNYYGLSVIGYMFNKEYIREFNDKSGEYYRTATWNGTTYTLTNGNNRATPDATHHYICDTDCSKIRYYYYGTTNYILLENGETIEDAIYKMTGTGDATTKAKTINANYELNNYNSAIKGYLDNWYKKNLTAYASYLDKSSVFCNDRSIGDLGGWNPNGTSITGTSAYLQFYQSQIAANGDLNCVNETDRFAVTNSKAKLTYPIGLLTEPERTLMGNDFATTGHYYIGLSPVGFSDNYAYIRGVDDFGDYTDFSIGPSHELRSVVSLRPGVEFSDGTGTYTDPYVVGPLVTRTN